MQVKTEEDTHLTSMHRSGGEDGFHPCLECGTQTLVWYQLVATRSLQFLIGVGLNRFHRGLGFRV